MNPIRICNVESYTKQLDAAYTTCMNRQTKEIVKGKLIDENLHVMDKPKGFWQRLKISVLCLLTLGFYDPFSHVRAYKVAITIFDSVTTYRKNLSDETLTKSAQLLEALNAKTKQKYKNDLTAVIEKIHSILEHNLLIRKGLEQGKQKTFQERMNERTEDKGIQIMIETLDESELDNKIKQAEEELAKKKQSDDFFTGTLNYINSWKPW